MIGTCINVLITKRLLRNKDKKAPNLGGLLLVGHLRHSKKELQYPGVYTNHTAVVGPFIFAKGPLYFLSSALARVVAAHRAVGREARAVIERGDDAPSGYVGMTACDDASIGYTVAQLADSGEPLHYISMPYDAYEGKSRAGLRLAAPAVVVHLYKKHAKSKSWGVEDVARQLPRHLAQK